jgi:RNA polymerase sigma factor (sigma-70 family)
MKHKPHSTATLAASVHSQFQGHLRRFLVRRLRSEQDAADLAQEVYLRLLSLKDSEQVREPLAYVYITASRLVGRFMSQAAQNPVAFDSEALAEMADDPGAESHDQLAERLSDARQLRRLLDMLPPIHRAVLILRKRDDLSYPEIARELGISVHTVKKYLYEAKSRLISVAWDRPDKEKT